MTELGKKIWLKNYPEWTVLFVRYQIVRTLLEQLTITLGISLSATGKIKEVSIVSFFLNLLPLLVLSLAFYNGASPDLYFPIVIFFMVLLTTAVRLYYCRKYCQLSIIHFNRKVILPCVFVCLVPDISWAYSVLGSDQDFTGPSFLLIFFVACETIEYAFLVDVT